MDLKSQISTTKEQSERLLALGVKPGTADMSIPIEGKPNPCPVLRPYYSWNGYWKRHGYVIPAWSLSRLVEMIPKSIQTEAGDYLLLITPLWISYTNILHGKIADEIKCICITRYGLFDELTDMIEWLIANGHFNKEYLT